MLGPSWEMMLASFRGKRAELMARSVRDNLADCLVTLPTLLAREARGSLHFWFANFDGMRVELFPALAAAYSAWNARDDAGALQAALGAGAVHWRNVAGDLLARFAQDEAAAELALTQWSSDPAAIGY